MSTIYTLPTVGQGDAPPASLASQIEDGLVGTPTTTTPGDQDEDKNWSYSRSIPTVVLYSEAGLR